MPGVWEFPGGKSLLGEEPDRTAIRECLEETGLRVVPGRLRLRIRHRYPHGTVDLHYYDCVVQDAASEPAPDSGFQWVAAAELPNLEFPEANEPILRALAEECAFPGIGAQPCP
jgi:8-oxo-dGTP diphosphatase